jgi:ubiquinone/menaquinone biosynthesis C-methylase UbiE
VIGCRRLRRRLFSLLYTRGASIYDLLAMFLFAGEWRHWQHAVVPLVRDDRVLDLGCGTGQLLPDLASRATLVVGLDRSPAMLRHARRRVVLSQIPLVLGDARSLPFRSGTFTTVVSTFPAEFILDEQVHDEIARVLVPGGRLLVVVFGVWSQWRWWQAPLVFALRILYGPIHQALEFADRPLTTDKLPGRWSWSPSRYGAALVWEAERTHD